MSGVQATLKRWGDEAGSDRKLSFLSLLLQMQWVIAALQQCSHSFSHIWADANKHLFIYFLNRSRWTSIVPKLGNADGFTMWGLNSGFNCCWAISSAGQSTGHVKTVASLEAKAVPFIISACSSPHCRGWLHYKHKRFWLTNYTSLELKLHTEKARQWISDHWVVNWIKEAERMVCGKHVCRRESPGLGFPVYVHSHQLCKLCVWIWHVKYSKAEESDLSLVWQIGCSLDVSFQLGLIYNTLTEILMQSSEILYVTGGQ